MPIYEKIGKLISDKIGCPVEVFVATGYNAEIEAMRNGKLELAEFGPLGYVLAHQVAKAEAMGAFGGADGKTVTLLGEHRDLSVVRHQNHRPTSAATRLHSPTRLRRRVTCSRPTGCARRGSILTRTSAIYAGSHTASFEAIYNHKVDAGELNSEQLEFGDAARPLQGRRPGFLVEVRSDPDRSVRGARRHARRLQEEAHGRRCNIST